MSKDAVMFAAIPDPPTKLTPDIKSDWNNFLDFVNSKGYRGNKDLDKRDTNLGRTILEEYRKTNPKSPLQYEMVKDIQHGILQDWELGKKIQQLQGVETNLDDRPLSEPDGWLGSLTSNGYFPTATTTDPKGKVIKDWGFDLDGYYNQLAREQAAKVPMMSKIK